MHLQRKPRQRRLGLDLAHLVVFPELVTRTVAISGRRTPVELESTVWEGLDDIARREGRDLDDLCTEICTGVMRGLSAESGIRVFVLRHYQDRAVA